MRQGVREAHTPTDLAGGGNMKTPLLENEEERERKKKQH